MLTNDEHAGYSEYATIEDPGTPAAGEKRLWLDDFHDKLFFTAKGPDGRNLRLSRDNVLVGRNVTGSTLSKGAAVYFSGANGNVPTFGLADASDPAKMPAVGLMFEDTANNSFGRVMIWGNLDLNTSGWSEGDALYVSASTPGALVTTAPTAPNLAQRIAIVSVSGVGNGSLVVTQTSVKAPVNLTSDVTNTLPVGNGGTGATSWTAGSIPFVVTGAGSFGQNNTGLFWDQTNGRLGLGTNAPDNVLDVRGTASPFVAVRQLAGNGFNGNGFVLKRDNTFGGGTPTNNDGAGFAMTVKQTDGTEATVAGIVGVITDVTNNVAIGEVQLSAKPTGNPASVFAQPVLVARGNGNVGIGTWAAGVAPQSKLHIEGQTGWIIIDEQDTDPTTANLDSQDACAIYMKNNKIVFAINDGGTMRYASLVLTGTGVTWVHNTTAP